MSKRRSQVILAGLILAGLALLSIKEPALTPWFVGWLLVGIVLSFAYKRREARLIAASVVALLVLAGIGIYPRWRGAMQQVEVTSGYGVARAVADRLQKYAKGHDGLLPHLDDRAWVAMLADLKHPYRHTPLQESLQVVELPHRAGLVTAAQSLEPDPRKAGDVTVYIAEGRYFAVVPRDEHGAALPFSDELSNLKSGNHGTGEARAVDKGLPGNQPDPSHS